MGVQATEVTADWARAGLIRARRGARRWPGRRARGWARRRTRRPGSPRARPRMWRAGSARGRWRRSSGERPRRSGRRRTERPGCHLVGGDGRPGAGPAADDRLIRPAGGHVAGGRLARPRPVVALGVAEGSVRDRLVPAAAKLLQQGVGDPSSLVGGDGYPHRPSLGATHDCRIYRDIGDKSDNPGVR
jgi:hypothetical protein